MRHAFVVGARVICAVVALSAQARAQDTAAPPTPVNEQAFVQIGGIEQWISIRGDSRDNPVILMLHGGPGVSNAPFAPAFRPWEKDFIVVEWDQRGAGRTFGRTGAEGSGALSIDRLVQDGIELTQHLRSRLQKEKVILLGLSFGSVLGLKMAKDASGVVRGASVGQFVNAAEATRSGTLTLAQARAIGNSEAIRALEAVRPPPWPDVDAQRGEGGQADDEGRRSGEQDERSGHVQEPSDFSDADLKNLAAGMADEPLVRDGMAFDARALGTRFPSPFSSSRARTTSTRRQLVRRWFDNLTAPARTS